MSDESDQLPALTDAIHHAWKAEAAGVNQFGLEPLVGRIKPEYGGWSVPVASGVPTGNAYELTRLLERLQEIAENKSHLSITFFLDPFAAPSARK